MSLHNETNGRIFPDELEEIIIEEVEDNELDNVPEEFLNLDQIGFGLTQVGCTYPGCEVYFPITDLGLPNLQSVGENLVVCLCEGHFSGVGLRYQLNDGYSIPTTTKNGKKRKRELDQDNDGYAKKRMKTRKTISTTS